MNQGVDESVGNIKESPGKEVEVARLALADRQFVISERI